MKITTTGTSAADLAGKIFQAKAHNCKAAAALPIEEKLRRLVVMQQRANVIRQSSNRPLMRVWELNQGLNGCVRDITSQPPGTIERE